MVFKIYSLWNDGNQHIYLSIGPNSHKLQMEKSFLRQIKHHITCTLGKIHQNTFILWRKRAASSNTTVLHLVSLGSGKLNSKDPTKGEFNSIKVRYDNSTYKCSSYQVSEKVIQPLHNPQYYLLSRV